MTMQEQIHNWLMIGLQQPADRLSEIFYYDSRDNQFFSILVTDYFMFDENFSIPKDTTTTYSEQNLKILIDRVKRIENKDTTIISLPRLGNKIDSLDTNYISQQTESFLTLHSINTNLATIWVIEENVRINIELDS